MNKLFLSSFQENLFQDKTPNYLSNLKNNSYKKISQTNSSLNKTSNQTYLKIAYNQTGIKNKKNGASFCLNLIHTQKRKKNEILPNYTQHIILHTDKKKINILEKENKTEIINLKTQKKEIDDNNKQKGNLVFNRDNIIRVIVSSEKMIKNFPMEYIEEMILDICYHLFNNECSFDKIQSINGISYNPTESNIFLVEKMKSFYDLRNFYFNFLMKIILDSSINESTLFLSYSIFDRYLCSTNTNIEEYLIIIITSFILAIKYNESSEANLDELCNICENKFTKDDINRYEIIIMEKLGYNLSIPTIFDLFQFIKIIKCLNEKQYFFGLFVLEMFVLKGGNLKYNAIIIMEAIYRFITETFGNQTKKVILYKYLVNSGINDIIYEENINNCLLEIKNDCLNIKNNNSFDFLINKFSVDKYQRISVDFQLV